MKFLHLFLFIFLFAKQSAAQGNHFIYIQTENKQPFYVKLADRLLSSSSSGYLVISKLEEGSYDLNIGFPSNEWPIQKITLIVKNKDEGYTLKNFDSKGWGLFNMQTMAVVMSTGNSSISPKPASDGFADVLADVVDAPSIKQNTEVKEEKMPADTITVEKPKTVTAVKEDKPVMEPVKAPVKISTTMDEDGRSAVYLDTYDSKTDTIRIFIPNEKEIPETKQEAKPTVKAETKQEPTDKKFLDIQMPNPNSKADSTSISKTAVPITVESNKTDMKKEGAVKDKEHTGVIMTNMNCKAAASEEDFSKLRKKMAAAKNDDDMIGLAKKAFKSKCYSTEQVASLSGWFLNDEGRYNFFDTAYPHVYDTANFSRLVNKLSDEYYITRFKAMLRH